MTRFGFQLSCFSNAFSWSWLGLSKLSLFFKVGGSHESDSPDSAVDPPLFTWEPCLGGCLILAKGIDVIIEEWVQCKEPASHKL